jgi:hypothetical protein
VSVDLHGKILARRQLEFLRTLEHRDDQLLMVCVRAALSSMSYRLPPILDPPSWGVAV